MRTVNDYMKMNYKLSVVPKQDFDASEYFVAYFEELKGLEGVGDTIEESIADLNIAKEIWFEKMLENEFDIPFPKSYEEQKPVKITYRIPTSINEDIEKYMKEEGVSKNQAINLLVAQSLESHKAIK
ncbi:type II toxin-antitoxin system HicB family antitoxin [Salinicoccus carnicancri]|uniref:type II toxin-antitoxin system HicB family antitoxin n=1 Tax=Salinicoccus carnicancri TaxID=558170 RepID=UPI0002F4423D|nr:type II toxin-antitoxin system HicB family antitoxin [Salinicoccus carnicancri]